MSKLHFVLAVAILGVSAAGADAGTNHGLKKGTPELKSAGPMTFGPDGILFIGDPKAASVFAVATDDTKGDPAKAKVNVDGVKQKVASMLGTTPAQTSIVDVAVNPASGNVYLSVARGNGPNATPVMMRVDTAGSLSEFSLKDVAFAKATLPNPAEDKEFTRRGRKQNNRAYSITDLAYVNEQVIVAGLTNEDFASNLRSIRFPFSDEVTSGSSVEIFHGAHGGLETRSPVRTFVPITFGGEPQIIAAYTCTPLVRFPLADLKPGKKVQGTTVAELGNRNRPLDIIAYKKGGKNFLLMANSSRGVMKISTEDIESREGIDERIRGTAGQPYDTIKELTDVTQLDQLNETHAVILTESRDGKSALKTIMLP